MQVPLEWKLSISGNNQVKSVMSDLNSAFERGQISGSEYADSMMRMAREGNKVANVSRYQNQIFMSMHPNLNKLSRGFSTFASIARTTLSLMQSINTLMIAQNTQSSSLAELEAQMAANRRELNRTIDPERIQQLNEEYSVLLAKEKELKDQDNVTYWEGWANAIIGIGLYANIFVKHLGSIVKILGTGGLAGLGIFAVVAGAVALAAEELYKFLFQVEDMDAWRAQNVQGLIDFFTISIPTALGEAAQYLTNFFLTDLPNWAKIGWQTVSDVFVTTWNSLMGFIETGINGALQGFSAFVNMIISGINKIIDGINNALGSNIPKIGPFVVDKISLPRIETGNTGAKSTTGVGTGITNNITVMGSILSERDLMTVIDKNTKQTYKSNGLSVN